MNYQLLLEHCDMALSGFKSDLHGVDEYLEDYLKGKDLENIEKDFLAEVFSGCIRCDPALKAVVALYHRTDGKTSRSSDVNLFKVLLYLMLFRLDELGVGNLRKFIFTQDIIKMHKFLTFFLDEVNLKTRVFSEWCLSYEHSYVQLTLLSPLLRWLPELLELQSRLADKINNRRKQRDGKPPTEVKEFALTQPRPRSMPFPEKIPKLKKYKPPPETLYKAPVEKIELDKAKELNRRSAEKRLIDSSMRQFSCASAEKSEKFKTRMQKLVDEENAKLKFNKHKASPFKVRSNDDKPIRLNAATILREGLLFQKKEEEEQKRFADYAMGGRDAFEFNKWQEEMKQRDLDNSLAEIERRRLEGKLSYEEAIIARQNLIKENKEKVKEIKKETKEIMQSYLEEKFKREKEMRELVEQIMTDEKNTKEAKRKLRQYKHKIVQEVNKESQELMKRALEEAEEEMKQKISLIAKIRAIESVPVIRFKFVDLTETSGAGLLGEMSVVELRERLALLKAAEKEEEEAKRNEIIQSKVERDQYLMDTLQNIAKERAARGKQASSKQTTQNKEGTTKNADPKLQELQEKLEAKKAERMKEKDRLTVRPHKPTARERSLAKEKKTLEEMRWREIERSREKIAGLHSGGTKDSGRLQLISS